MKFASIAHQFDNNKLKPYQLTSIYGIPFYLSTGENSGQPDTWLPFMGVLPKSEGDFSRGWYLKPTLFSEDYIPATILRFIHRFIYNGYKVADRFASLPCLLISSCLGGGLWNSRKGRILKNILQNRYPDFCRNWGSSEISLPKKSFQYDEVEAINQWLCQQANVDFYEQLSEKIPKDLSCLDSIVRESVQTSKLDDLYTYLQRPRSSELEIGEIECVPLPQIKFNQKNNLASEFTVLKVGTSNRRSISVKLK